MRRVQFSPRATAFGSLASVGLIACTSVISEPGGASGSSGFAGVPQTGAGASAPVGGGAGSALSYGGSAGASSGSAPSSAGGASAGASSSSPGGGSSCSGTDLTAAKRIVRLSFNQLANSIGTLVSDTLTPKLITDNDILDREHRAFPPLQSPREGNSVTDSTWKTMDSMAAAAGKYVFDNFAAVTSCGATPSDACALQYLTGLAQKAYRRPLSTAEQTRISTLYTTTFRAEAGASINEAVQYGVYAILQSPQFVYRTEFGEDWQQDGPLTGTELASLLSYFVTDDLPDQELLDAGAQGKLATPEQIGLQVDRLLKTDAAKKNLHGAMMSYFSYPQLESVKIDDKAFTDGVRNSMYHEAELFLQNTLWSGKLTDLLLAKKSVVNASLAQIYGIAQFPPSGVMLDADGFGLVELPATRMGLLTQAGFLATRSRPDKTSVVGRGLLIKNALLCSETPSPPESIADKIAEISMANADASERELADIRAATSPCNTCHSSFDAYGLAVDSYDVIGRYRTMDSQGRPIDTRVTLPVQVGGGTAQDVLEVAQKIADSGGFAKCMGRNLINYALADVSSGAAEIDSCAAEHVAQSFAATDQSFSSLIKAVATSATFVNRSKGAAE